MGESMRDAVRALWLPSAVTAGVALGMVFVVGLGNRVLFPRDPLAVERDAWRREQLRHPAVGPGPGGMAGVDLIPPTSLPLIPKSEE